MKWGDGSVQHIQKMTLVIKSTHIMIKTIFWKVELILASLVFKSFKINAGLNAHFEFLLETRLSRGLLRGAIWDSVRVWLILTSLPHFLSVKSKFHIRNHPSSIFSLMVTPISSDSSLILWKASWMTFDFGSRIAQTIWANDMAEKWYVRFHNLMWRKRCNPVMPLF